MFIHSLEFIKRVTLDSIPAKLKNYKEETKCKWYQLLYDEELGKDFEKKDMGLVEPYYGQSKDSAKQQMSHVKSGKRNYMTSKVLVFISKNMGISVSELLWGDKKDWQQLLPALFYLIVAESVNSSDVSFNKKLSLQDKALSILKDSVIFSKELAKKEIAAEGLDGIIYFKIPNDALATAIFRLYQSDVANKFCSLFEEMFITNNYSMGYLERKIKLFAERVFQEVLQGYDNNVNSIGYQVYKTYDLYFSHESKEHLASFSIREVLKTELAKNSQDVADLQLDYYLDREQEILYRSIDRFVNELNRVQKIQDERLGIRLAKKTLFKKGFETAGFDKDYFIKAYLEADDIISNEPLSPTEWIKFLSKELNNNNLSI